MKFEGWGREEHTRPRVENSDEWCRQAYVQLSGGQINKLPERISLKRERQLGEMQGLLKDATQSGLQGSKYSKTILGSRNS